VKPKYKTRRTRTPDETVEAWAQIPSQQIEIEGLAGALKEAGFWLEAIRDALATPEHAKLKRAILKAGLRVRFIVSAGGAK
jgi:hypothetical protein